MADLLKFRYRAKLQVSVPLTTTLFLHPVHEFLKITRIVQKRLAMVGERERYQARSCEPTRNAAQHYAIFEFCSRGRGRNYQWLVLVRASQGLQPAPVVKCRRFWMAGNQIIPTDVRERV